MNRFLDIEDLEDGQIEHLLAVARQLERSPVCNDLAGRVLGLVFMNPSLRTLTSFQAGMSQLGGSSSEVLAGLGLEPRPPHPEGYEMAASDFSILDPVRKRSKLYRD